MSTKVTQQPDTLALTLAMLLLRLWLGFRSLVTGIEKFAGTATVNRAVLVDGVPNDYGLTETASVKVYGLANYHGVPVPLYDKFVGEPLIPAWGLIAYDWILGPLLLILGIALLLGLATRFSLFFMGLLYTSLTFGLILIKQDPGVAWLGTHIVLIVLALALAKYNRFAILKKW